VTKKETLREHLKVLSPVHLHYVWGLLDGLCHKGNPGEGAGPEKPEENDRDCLPLTGRRQDYP
jgi:hypothetical protein